MAPASFVDIQRQFTSYLRDPENAALPAGADPRRMRFYVKAYRTKLVFLLAKRVPALIRALGRDETLSLIDDYVRLPREAASGKSSFEESFVDYVKETGAGRGLRPFIPDLADFCIRGLAILESAREIGDDDVDRNGDLLAGVPVFSELAEVLACEWPVHRIGAELPPEAVPRQPTWLVLYRDREGGAGYLELNRPAADIALRVRDNAAGKTGEEILADPGNRNPLHDPDSLMRDGLGVLESLRQRDIIIGVRAGTV